MNRLGLLNVLDHTPDDPSGPAKGQHGVVDEVGRPYHPDTLSDFWRELCGRAGVHKIRLHDARHSCASIMHAQGVPIAAISAWLGHRDTAFTMRTYVHAQNDALKQPRPLCNVL